MKAFRMFSCERTVNFDHFFVYNTLAYWKRSDLLSIDAISIAMSSSSDEDSDITYNNEESVSEDLREAYQKVRREVYAIRKREKNPTFDLEEEEPRLIDLLNSAQKKGKVPEYNSDTWDDTKFVLLTILVSGALGFGLYYTLHAFGMYELEDENWFNHADDL